MQAASPYFPCHASLPLSRAAILRSPCVYYQSWYRYAGCAFLSCARGVRATSSFAGLATSVSRVHLEGGVNSRRSKKVCSRKGVLGIRDSIIDKSVFLTHAHATAVRELVMGQASVPVRTRLRVHGRRPLRCVLRVLATWWSATGVLCLGPAVIQWLALQVGVATGSEKSSKYARMIPKYGIVSP